MITTKKLFGALVALTMSVAMVSCAGDDGEQGPAGPAGAAGNANVNEYTFTVTSNDWGRTGNSAISYDTLDVSAINQSVLDEGAVQVYQTFDDSLGWNAMPYRYLTLDQSGNSVTNANLRATYNVGIVSLSHYTDDRLLAPINDMQIKVVVIPSSALVEGVDPTDYEALQAVYGLE